MVFGPDMDLVIDFELLVEQVVRVVLGQGHEAVDQEVLVFACHAGDSTVPNGVVSGLVDRLALNRIVEEVLRVDTSDLVFNHALR